jgi:hypothetical protein
MNNSLIIGRAGGSRALQLTLAGFTSKRTTTINLLAKGNHALVSSRLHRQI